MGYIDRGSCSEPDLQWDADAGAFLPLEVKAEIPAELPIAKLVSEITGIDMEYLRYKGRAVTEASVAERMSWAARRTTTRPEDEAYCLLGLFDINLPLLYGE